jgi:hypothetical protein
VRQSPLNDPAYGDGRDQGFQITQFTFDEESASAEDNEGCALALVGELLAKMQGRPFPMTMDITADEEGSGTAVMVIDMSALAAELAAENPDMDVDATNEPQIIRFAYDGNTLTFQLDQSSGGVTSMTGTVSRQGEDLVMKGTLSGTGSGYSLLAVWSVTKE